MPIYTYRCRDCGKEFESLQRMNEDPIESHLCDPCDPDSNEGTVDRIPAVAALKFIGSGFHVNDYPKDTK